MPPRPPRRPDDRRGPPPRGGRPGPRHEGPRPERHEGPRPRHEAPRPAPATKDGEELVYGLRAGLALVAARPEDVREVLCNGVARAELDALLAETRGPRLAVVERTPVDLERLVGTRQHENLVVRARARRWLSPAELGDILARNKGTALALDRVRNPYNIGAILRSAAFFGVEAALLGAPAPHPALAADAVRVAEGGVEHLLLSRTTDLAETLARLRTRGVQVVGADGASDVSAIGFRFARPTILVVGNEREGMHERVRAQCDAVVAIRGTGHVESLNVAVAASVLVAELTRPR